MQSGRFFVCLFFVAALLISFSGYAFDDNDFQFWHTAGLSMKLNDKWSVQLQEEFRLADDAGDFYYQHSDLGFVYSGLTKWLDVGANYRQVFEEKNKEWKEENQPHLNANFKFKVLSSDISNRCRFEYRNREDAEDYWRYRNKFTVKLPFKVTKLEIQPYVADEVFYDFNVNTMNKNRAYAGFIFKIVKNLKADIYYMLDSSEKGEEWIDSHILGTSVTYSF